ncbi:plasmid pRiA4b ORF-3 family protein [Patescibacteria group bacterium]|nr:plasmid pRiA4b ORF-3 family protein [Patescibacteria group bacterium]
MVIRKHVNDNFTVGFYLVDLLCLGVKDAHYVFNISQHEFNEGFAINELKLLTEKIPYNLAHNIIYAGIEFAEDYGFKPHKTFTSVAQYILEEDTDEIEYLDIPCGHEDDAKPVFFKGADDDEAFVKRVLTQLEKTAGPNNYYFYDEDANDQWDDSEELDADAPLDFPIRDDFGLWLNDIIEDELNKLDEAKKKNSTTFQFKIQIKNISKPTVWRKISVPSYYSFALLHHIIQAVFGWENAHLYQFSDNGFHSDTVITAIVDDDFDDMGEQREASEVLLLDVFKNEGQKYTYIYDFGDSWEHDIVLEKIIPEQSETPKLLAGKGACPPEDCGGPGGYENLKTILADPKHKEYKDYEEWLQLFEGQKWDSDEFDLEDTQLYLEEMFDRE